MFLIQRYRALLCVCVFHRPSVTAGQTVGVDRCRSIKPRLIAKRKKNNKNTARPTDRTAVVVVVVVHILIRPNQLSFEISRRCRRCSDVNGKPKIGRCCARIYRQTDRQTQLHTSLKGHVKRKQKRVEAAAAPASLDGSKYKTKKGERSIQSILLYRYIEPERVCTGPSLFRNARYVTNPEKAKTIMNKIRPMV